MSDIHDVIDSLRDSAAALFEEVREATADIHGVTRDAFGAKETRAGEILIEFCGRHVLEARFDEVATLAVTLSPQKGPSHILLASHLDSVPVGLGLSHWMRSTAGWRSGYRRPPLRNRF
jgi:acetylornithine deacetylase/succinyl-diaminopimelate desuccinylase-like protein